MSSAKVGADDDGRRADAFVRTAVPDTSAAERKAWFRAGRVRVAGRPLRAGDVLRKGDEVELPSLDGWLKPWAEGPLFVLHADSALVVVDKQAGEHCHPLVRGEGGTTLDKVVARFPDVADAGPDPREGGLCHRLDVGTSGVLLFARTATLRQEVMAAFAGRGARKAYLALVDGRPPDGLVEAPLAHHPSNRTKMVVAEGRHRGRAQRASSQVVVLGSSGGRSLVKVQTKTGRRHQVRVHLAHLGSPLVGDALYGGPGDRGFAFPALHAWSVTVAGRGPFVAPLPATWQPAASAMGIRPESLTAP